MNNERTKKIMFISNTGVDIVKLLENMTDLIGYEMDVFDGDTMIIKIEEKDVLNEKR